MRNWHFVLAALVIAVIAHWASVAAVPHLVMSRAFAAMARGGTNTMIHTPRATARSRVVVRPSPDLLYSTCVYDLAAAGGRVRVETHGMPHTYWSVSLFDAETNNFHVVDDRMTKGKDVALTIVPPGATGGIVSPTARGVVLVRTLIDDERRLSAIDAARRRATCRPG